MMENSTVSETRIREEIMSLEPNKRSTLLQWLIQVARQDWDRELMEDFSTEGPGVELLNQVREDFHF
jgi:hypothetical protein